MFIDQARTETGGKNRSEVKYIYSLVMSAYRKNRYVTNW